MPRQRPATSGYARLAQADEEEGRLSLELTDEEDLNEASTLSTRYESIIPPGPRDAMRTASNASASKRRPRTRRRMRSNSSGIDIKAINARLERWADEIASKFKISSTKGKSDEEERLEIHHSVFQAPDGIRPYTAEQLALLPTDGPDSITREEFEAVVDSVRVAIEMGVHPKMISQGSSGSYFARNASGKVVGVFKPKDEEPYASRNPKWTKWIHRNLFPCFFGRACLIPNLSYVSEAAAYVLDSQLRTNLVPYTDVVWLSSKSFFYDFWERNNFFGKKKSLPAKVGSFQYFLKGYKDANIFLREHPWPDQNVNDFTPDLEHKHKRRPLANCMPGGAVSDEEGEAARVISPPPADDIPRFSWTSNIKQAFREELEKLVILDYIMRNTDRGLDNWMIKIDYKTEEVSIVAEPPRERPTESLAPGPRPVSISPQRPESNTSRPYKRYEAMDSRSSTPQLVTSPVPGSGPSIKIGAIDNSLSWPWKHPDAWRSFPFGWLFLPVSLIGQPFSAKTRAHFLPLLTSTAWWSETQIRLRRIFAQDDDFKESMFARQIAVMKGQAWNVVETLKQQDHGPLELTRRTRVCVWDDLVDVPVAIPMRTSIDAQRSGKKHVRINDEEEEFDIGVNHASAPASKTHTHAAPSMDLLGSPTTELPNPNRFELTRETSDADLGRSSADQTNGEPSGPPSPDLTYRDRGEESSAFYFQSREAHERLSNSMTLPDRPRKKSKSRFSLELPRGLSRTTSATNANPGSSSRMEGRRRANSTRLPGSKGGSSKFVEYDEYDDDEAAGDLGYSAATGMERMRRKVIVERLEAVKSRNPVFTWC